MPLVQNSKKANVVNISSMGSFQGCIKFAGLATYKSSKAAIASLTEEYKKTSIKFNYLALGAIATEMLAESLPNYKTPISSKDMAKFNCGLFTKWTLYF